jgi:dipeptidase E
MLSQARLTGFDKFISEFISRGGIYIGTSTGSFIMAEDTAPGLALENYFEDDFDSTGLGLVNFLVMPHWGTDDFKNNYQNFPKLAYDSNMPMLILNDFQYVWVKDNKFQIIDVSKLIDIEENQPV